MNPNPTQTFSTQCQVAQAFHCSHYQARLVEQALQSPLPCQMNPLEALAVLHSQRIEMQEDRGYFEEK